jgi:hypothetical protein
MYLNCPFCGLQVNTLDTSCHKECPLGKSCKMICCPNCKYSFVLPESKIVDTFKRFFGGREKND